MNVNPKVDWFFDKDTKWQMAYEKLRSIILDCGLNEELKWGKPCYTLNGNNVVLIHGFKDYCALLYHKGVLLKDSEDILIQQTEHVQAARQLRFTSADKVELMQETIKAYTHEAMEVEKAGLEVKFKTTLQFDMPEEFQKALDDSAEFKAAFEALTPGRQRGYLLYFSRAKQSKTRESRIEKYYEQILHGKGLDD